MPRRNSDAGRRATFGEVLGTRDPAAIQKAMFATLEQARLDHIAASRESAADDRKVLEGEMKDLMGRVPRERLRRLAGLIGLIAELEAQAKAAAKAVKTAPAMPAGGWLVIGRVREYDGAPAKGGQISWEGAGESGLRLLNPVKIGADGNVSFALEARAVAEIVKSGEVQVRIVARVDDRVVFDVAPARIAANGLHQFDLVLPPPRGPGARR